MATVGRADRREDQGPSSQGIEQQETSSRKRAARERAAGNEQSGNEQPGKRAAREVRCVTAVGTSCGRRRVCRTFARCVAYAATGGLPLHPADVNSSGLRVNAQCLCVNAWDRRGSAVDRLCGGPARRGTGAGEVACGPRLGPRPSAGGGPKFGGAVTVRQIVAGTSVCGAGPRCGWMQLPSGSSSPVSSKMITPLQRRLHPCSGWQDTTLAASRSTASAFGQGGWCSHISSFLRCGCCPGHCDQQRTLLLKTTHLRAGDTHLTSQ